MGIDTVRVASRGPDALLDPQYHIGEMDFIVKSHLLGRLVPHPIPPGMGQDPEQIALASFSPHGRRGCFATYADTLAL